MDASQRQAPTPTRPPLPLLIPGPPTSLTALNPRGGGPEADDQARPVSGAVSVPGPGSILPAKSRRRVRPRNSEPPTRGRVRVGV